MAAIEQNEIFACSSCHKKFHADVFKISRLGIQNKSCIECAIRRKEIRPVGDLRKLCTHEKRKDRCGMCCGKSIEPPKIKTHCIKCENGIPGICKFCNTTGYLKNTLKHRAYRELKRTPADDELFELLGCDIETYKNYIEAQFDGEMSWGTHGVSGWVICPIHYRFLYKDDKYKDDPKIVLHHTIMGPLWAE